MKDDVMTDTDAPEWPGPADEAHAVEQAKWLGNQVAEGGLRFEAYLPPSLALWLLDLIEQGKFLDPSEAVSVILGEHQELEPHADLRRELFKRRIQAAIDDPRPGISGEMMKRLRG
ncbi:hypothetical protein ABDF71_27200 [Ochrobactrum sp. WV_118_8]|uniref:hypothetical protein n=1 Tax=Brucella anthropi TaxID=529 RepID=UPI001FD3589B|nr:hypothetical protein [Brucella anthropi]